MWGRIRHFSQGTVSVCYNGRNEFEATIMLRTPSSRKLLSICLLAGAAYANAQQTPSSAPPKLERIEEGSDTPITVTPQTSGQHKITEKKEGGRVTEVQVKSGKSTYVMKPNVPAGNAQPGDGAAASAASLQISTRISAGLPLDTGALSTDFSYSSLAHGSFYRGQSG
jgi:hypothetical protein